MVHRVIQNGTGADAASSRDAPTVIEFPAFDGSRDGLPEAAWIHRPARALHGAPQGALAGLQFGVKDNIDVAGWPTTAACPAWSRTATVHAVVVQRLLDAGAICLGKTNLDQFACGLNGTRSPYGAVPNSFDPRYVSGGSSSGSARIVATAEADFALGTDTAGSGRVPAGLNNIVGVKPSRGLIAATGVLPAARSADCVSIFAPTVELGMRVLAAAIGVDPGDPLSRRLDLSPAWWPARFRFGVPRDPVFHGDEAARAAFDQACDGLRALGGTAVAIDYRPLAATAALLYDSALVAERLAAIHEFFDRHEADVIEPVRGILASGRRYSAADLVDARLRLSRLALQAAAIWDDIDVLVVPTAPTHCTIAAMRAAPVEMNRRLGEYTNFVNLLDLAALSVPASIRPDGLPFGITLIGRAGSDFALAALGQRFHHATGLARGATGQPLGDPLPLPGPPPGSDRVLVAVVGAHLSGMPLNGELLQRDARLVAVTTTAPCYRLFALPGTTPPKPGLVRVRDGEGAAIAVEVWSMPVSGYGSFVAGIPAPLGIGCLELADGSSVQGFVCDPIATRDAIDITVLGGWRRYIAEQSLTVPSR